jgi:Holliday junction resolvase-like predicted endonuclease
MAELYLFDKEIDEADCRFDVVAIILGSGSNPIINHYENAFY